MKRIKFTSSFLMVAAAFAALPGFAVTVSTVAELKAAVEGASAGDTIVITTSLTPSASDFTTEESDDSKSFLTVTKDNITIMGADESSRKTWEQEAEPVIIDCGGLGRFLQNNGNNLTVKNIAVTGCKLVAANQYGTIAQGNLCTFTNCVFRQNLGTRPAFWAHGNFILRDCSYVSNVAPFTGSAYGCDFSNSTSQAKFVHHLYDCNFTGYRNSDAAIVLNGEEKAGTIVSNCHFSSCMAMPLLQPQANYKTMIMDCVFEDNTNTLISATLKDTDANGVVVSNCTFTANVIVLANGDKTKYLPVSTGNGTLGFLVANSTNNFASAAMAQARFSLVDSDFSGSEFVPAWGMQGMAEVYGVRAVGCTFGAHATYPYKTWNYFNGSAFLAHLEDCDMANGDIAYSVVDRCNIHDVTNGMYACVREYCRVTNTLVENCGTMLYAVNAAASGGSHDAEFVNCTFVANKGQTYRSLYYGDSTNDVKFVNCLFNSNRKGSTESDFTIQDNEDSTLNCWTSKVSFAHCFYGKFTASGNLTAARFAAMTGENLLVLCENPRFAGEPAWSLLPKSPLIGKGDASIWTAEDVDLAGNLRLKDGKVDPGCYQCWLREPGMTMIVW